MKIVDNSIKRENDFKLQLAVPFKTDKPRMPNNFGNALRRLRTQQKALKGCADLKQKYIEKIQRLKSEGYIEAVPKEEINKPDGVWYLPHFSTKQSKFRVVYDGSAGYKGKVINDEIFSGPDLMVPLFDVITRFRMGKYAAMADLKECFFQIGIPPEQRDYFRIIWYKNDDIDGEIEILRFTVHVWGIISSPYIATRGIHAVAQQNRTRASPQTVGALKDNTYVDDLLKSMDTIQQMKQLYSESTALFADSGFQLTKWAANSDEVLEMIPEESHAPSSTKVITEEGHDASVHGTMGLQWETENDTLTLATKDDIKLIQTKRGMLSYLHSFLIQ
jgi:hypothetical protein